MDNLLQHVLDKLLPLFDLAAQNLRNQIDPLDAPRQRVRDAADDLRRACLDRVGRTTELGTTELVTFGIHAGQVVETLSPYLNFEGAPHARGYVEGMRQAVLRLPLAAPDAPKG